MYVYLQLNKNIRGIVYFESIKRELKIRGIHECRCDERLQSKTKEFTRLAYTGLILELEHLKIETSFIDSTAVFCKRVAPGVFYF